MKDSSGLLFVAAMFIGMGIGMMFNMAGAGTIVGMGVGFLFMAIYRTRDVKHKFTFPSDEGRIGILVLGLILIGAGICMLACPRSAYVYLGAIGIIGLGVFFLLLGLKRDEDKKQES